MNRIKNLIDTNSPYSFIIRFLFFFLALYYFFPFYRGVIGPGGKLYSSFLEHNLNLITAFTKFLTGSAKVLLDIAGYDTVQKNYHSLKIGYSRGISVNPSCLGWGVMSFWAAFVLADKGSARHKAKWAVGGITLIVLLNITRIALIALANHLNWSPITSLDHHMTFNIASYACIIMLVAVYIRMQKKYERTYISSEQTERKLSTV